MAAPAVPYFRLSDEALIVLAGRAHAPALAEFYARYRAPAHGLARRILGDTDLAEDAVQDAFLSAWRSARRFSPERGHARAWILTLVHHRAVDIVRSRAASEPVDPMPDAPDPTAEAALDAVADRDRVLGLLRGLPAEIRAPVALAYYGGLSQRECASRLSEPIGTVKSRTSRGLTRMRQQLARPGTAGPPGSEHGVRGPRGGQP